MISLTSLKDKLFGNKLLLALVASVAIVAILFYSVPAAAFYMGGTPTLQYTPGNPNVNVTVTLYKSDPLEVVTTENVTAQLLYITGGASANVTATNCSFTNLGYSNAYGYGYDFYGYGYGSSSLIAMMSGYNGYSYGYGNASGTTFTCTFNFNSTHTMNRTITGITVYVVGINLLNQSAVASAANYLEFSKVIAFQQTPGANTSATTFVTNAASSINFTLPNNGGMPMQVSVGDATTITTPTGYTPGFITIDVLPPSEKPAALNDSKTMGPVLELGPAGATFNPAINISFNMSVVKNQSGKTIVQLRSLYEQGYLKIRKVNASGTYDLATTWVGGTGETCQDCMLVTSITSFSSFGTYDATPAPTPTPSSGGNNGGGSITGAASASSTKLTNTTQVDIGAGVYCPVTITRELESGTNRSVVTVTLANMGGANCNMQDFVFSDTIPSSFPAINELTFNPMYSSREGWMVTFNFPSFASGESKTLTYSADTWIGSSKVKNFTAYLMSAKKTATAQPTTPTANQTSPSKEEQSVWIPTRLPANFGQIEPAAPAAPGEPQPEPKSSLPGILATLLIVLVVLGGIAAVAIHIKGKKKKGM